MLILHQRDENVMKYNPVTNKTLIQFSKLYTSTCIFLKTSNNFNVVIEDDHLNKWAFLTASDLTSSMHSIVLANNSIPRV